MKKVIAALMSAAMLFGAAGTVYGDGSDKTEIRFKVGDSVLSINGKSVEVETPYVVGEGTTLVPLRVITEAFGAEVNWEDAEQKITLNYPDVKIILQIGNGTAVVNTHNETLLAAPVLKNDTTMVPLRFISETFGADVSYDEATEAITVVKDAAAAGSTITGITELSRIGDSSYGWSIDTPEDMEMTDRSFGGMFTVFEGADESSLSISVFPLNLDLSFDKYFSNMKDSYSGSTLIRADKGTTERGNKYMHFEAKDSEVYNEYYCYYLSDKVIEISAFALNNADSAKTMLNSLTASFKIGFGDTSATYDLSDVKDGKHKYTNEKFKLSFDLPSSWVLGNYSIENEINFTEFKFDSDESVLLSIYSKNDSTDAKSLAEKDYAYNTDYLNKSAYESEPVAEYKLNDAISGYKYKLTKKTGVKPYDVLTDIFFEVGDYVYNISVHSADKPNSDLIEMICGSLTAEPIDKNTVGVLLRNDVEDEGEYTSSADSWLIKLPMLWDDRTVSDDGALYVHKVTGAAIVMSVTNENASANDLNKAMTTLYNGVKSSGNSILSNIETKMMGNLVMSTFSYTMKTDSETLYCTAYAGIKNKKLYAFSVTLPEGCSGGPLEEETQKIISSFAIKK